MAERCKVIQSPDVLPGFGCCHCRIYNRIDRPHCRGCGHAYCGPKFKVIKFVTVPCSDGPGTIDAPTEIEVLDAVQ